jgi:hypothetical protein
MIGRPEWFKYRIFGWGVAPKTWQGWLYGAIAALLIGLTLSISINEPTRKWIFALIFVIFIADIMHIMMQLPKVTDERENYHQLIIERNCSFAAIIALVGVMLYQSYQNKALFQANPGISTLGMFPFDISIIIVLGAMLLTKVLSTVYVRARM